MKNSIPFLPVFNNISSLHRVFGDAVQSTEICKQENVLSAPLLQAGKVAIRVRSFHWKPSFAKAGIITNRFECYYDGVLVDYSMERSLIVRTFRWLSEKGQINQPAL